MKTIEQTNDEILLEWKNSDQDRFPDDNFTSDGLVCDNDLWTSAPLRILFVGKDQNASDGNAWDLKDESMDMTSFAYKFNRNLQYIHYGLSHTTKDKRMGWDDFTKEESNEFYHNSAIARINVKKQAGAESISNKVLLEFVNKDKEFIKRQIINLDADVILCLGYSEAIPDTHNIILNFLKDNCYTGVKKVNSWIYYDADANKVLINSWHLSYRSIKECDFYNGMIDAYYEFLQLYPDFIKHR